MSAAGGSVAPVSVVIPCYRCAGTIGRALASVQAQTRRPAEVMLVDDASADETPNVLRALAAQAPASLPVRVLTLPSNRGAAAARNSGWDAARQRYVAFLDADDSWHPRKLEIQVALMERDAGMAASGHLHLVAPSPEYGELHANPRVRSISFRDLLLSNRFITSSAMVRRELPLRFPEGQRHMEDQRLWFETAHRGHRLGRIEEALGAHHKPDFGASGLSANLVAMERAEIGNYLALYRERAVGIFLLPLLLLWSLAKFIRRVLIVLFRGRRSGLA